MLLPIFGGAHKKKRGHNYCMLRENHMVLKKYVNRKQEAIDKWYVIKDRNIEYDYRSTIGKFS